MIETQQRAKWDALRPLVFGAGGILALVVFALAMLVSMALTKRASVQRAWAASLGTREEVLQRYPAREANAAARALETLTLPLGIDIATRSDDDRDRPTRDQAARFHKVRGPLSGYLTRELERADASIAAPPEIVTVYLRESRSALQAVKAHLLGDAAPRWELEIDQWFAASIPNLLGHINLQKVLLTDALVAAREGRADAALADLEASWKLNLALRNDPVLITQLIVVAGARLQAGTLRKIDEVPEIWRRRVSGQDYRKAVVTALQLEGWTWVQADYEMADDNPVGDVLIKVARPYVRYCMADVSERWRRRMVRLPESAPLCDGGGESAPLDVPFWNRPGRMMVPNILDALDRVARLELDLELTDKLLRLRAQRAANGGRWPDAVPEIEDSAACPRDRWVYETDPEGGVSIALSREVEWPGSSGAILPTRFISEAAVR